jgi:hypothetical protein
MSLAMCPFSDALGPTSVVAGRAWLARNARGREQGAPCGAAISASHISSFSLASEIVLQSFVRNAHSDMAEGLKIGAVAALQGEHLMSKDLSVQKR